MMPLYGGGLWLAVMTAPPAASRCLTMTPTPGVERIPRSTARQPAAARPARRASASIGPDGRESRPTTTAPPPRCVP